MAKSFPRRWLVWFNRSMQKSDWNLLRRVSRSFYLTLRVLPVQIRPQVGLAYLLARATDTIADTQLVTVGQRRAALRQVREALCSVAEDQGPEKMDFGELVSAQAATAGRGSLAEEMLLESTDRLIEELSSLRSSDCRLICDLLEIIIQGQDSDLVRFGASSPERIAALESDRELEEYTYRVAGCVGEFWTRMCRAHIPVKAELDDTKLLVDGIRFGKGLQMVNILRDLPGDLRQGRCYIPRARLAEWGLEPAALLHADEMGRFRPLYSHYIEQARDLLAAGWTYTNSLPRSLVRVRLATAWPALIGAKTLARLRAGNVLDHRHRIRIRRSEVRGIVIHSLLCYPNPIAWNRLFADAGADPREWPL